MLALRVKSGGEGRRRESEKELAMVSEGHTNCCATAMAGLRACALALRSDADNFFPNVYPSFVFRATIPTFQHNTKLGKSARAVRHGTPAGGDVLCCQ